MAVTGTISAILGVIGTVLGVIWKVISTIFGVFSWIWNRIRTRIQKRIEKRRERRERVKQFFRRTWEFIGRVFRWLFTLLKYFLIVFLVIFQGIFGFLVYNTKRFLNDILQDGFGKPLTKTRSTFDNFIILLTLFFDNLRTSLKELWDSLMPFFLTLPLLIPSVGLVILVSYGISIFLPQFFIISQSISQIIILFFDAAVNVLNFIAATLGAIAASFNAYLDLLRIFIVESFKQLCSGAWNGTQFSFSGDLVQDCPSINIFLNFLAVSYNTIFAILRLISNFIGGIFTIIGGIICPGGTCSSFTCQTYNNTPTCTYNASMATSWILQAFTSVISFVFPILLELVFFIFDLFVVIVGFFSGLYDAFAGQADSLSMFLKGVIDGGSQSLLATLPQTFTRDVLLQISNILIIIFRAFIITLRELAIAFDYIICNVFIQFLRCFLPKTCHFLFRDITFYIPGIFGPIPIFIPLSQLCVALGLNLGNCPCDQCIYYTITGLTGLIGLAVNGVYGNLYVPCNPNGSCPIGCSPSNTNSILRAILTI